MDSGPWPAPAKLNLFLHVTGRRADGYHSLQTLFQLLDLADELRFHRAPPGSIRRLGQVPGVAPEQDLTVRAARALATRAGLDPGLAIELHKRIPMGGGLGGGSSDAATVLAALSRLWELELPAGTLPALALELGADVPVFLAGSSAWAEGVGEKLTPVALQDSWYLVIHPGVHVSTADVFNDPQLTRNTPPLKIADLFGHDEVVDVGRLMALTANDCEAVVRRRYPAVDAALRWLHGFAPARMTGTGACVFAPFPSREQARAVLARLPGHWQGMVARGLGRSPLQARLGREA